MTLDEWEFLTDEAQFISHFSFRGSAFCIFSQRLLPTRGQIFFYIFLWKFHSIDLIVRSMIYAKLILCVVWDRSWGSSPPICLFISCSTICWKGFYFPNWIHWYLCWKSICVGLFLDSTPFHWSIYLLGKVTWLCPTLWDPMDPIEFSKPEYYDPN